MKILALHSDDWRNATLSGLTTDQEISNDAILIHGDGGFGVKVIKNRFGRTGIFEDKHWTEVADGLRTHKQEAEKLAARMIELN